VPESGFQTGLSCSQLRLQRPSSSIHAYSLQLWKPRRGHCRCANQQRGLRTGLSSSPLEDCPRDGVGRVEAGQPVLILGKVLPLSWSLSFSLCEMGGMRWLPFRVAGEDYERGCTEWSAAIVIILWYYYLDPRLPCRHIGPQLSPSGEAQMLRLQFVSLHPSVSFAGSLPLGSG